MVIKRKKNIAFHKSYIYKKLTKWSKKIESNSNNIKRTLGI